MTTASSASSGSPGPASPTAYWNDPEATAEVFGARLAVATPDTRSFLRTGDLAFCLDAELFVVGRIKELIIVRGRNILPQDIEATVQASHPALRPGCGAAFALDSDAGELLVVAQELRDGATGTERSQGRHRRRRARRSRDRALEAPAGVNVDRAVELTPA